ncbi:MAG: DUF2807 domain-containing protein [Gammaproteobacteria bacterium]
MKRKLQKVIFGLLGGFLVLWTMPASASHSPYLPKSYHSEPRHAKARVAKSSHPKTLPPCATIHNSVNFPYFSALDIQGPFQVNLTTQKGKQSVDFSGSVDALSHLSARVVNNMLILRWIVKKDELLPANPWITVKINMPTSLTRIVIGRNAELHGNGISSAGLSLITYDHANVDLSGNIRISSILANSDGYININTTSSQHSLFVGGSGPGTIHLGAGYTPLLTARLFNGLNLDAHALHAQKVYVAVQGHALAEVYPIDSLYAFASAAGNIYYYNRPRFLVRSTRDAGNVLYLGRNMQPPTLLPVPLN